MMHKSEINFNGPKVGSWAQFTRIVKQPDKSLLARLDDFSQPILVAGCQRSGTTALTRLLATADGITDFRFGADDELDAALILAGHVSASIKGRAVFQTTYLNERFREYFEHDDFRLVWVIREPVSVVRSMLYHWKRGALNRLYAACGAASACRWNGKLASARRPLLGPSRLQKACASYVGKVCQTFDLAARLVPKRMIVVDYDELVLHKDILLPEIFEFVELPYRAELAEKLHARSVNKGAELPASKAAYVEEMCAPTYERARAWRIRVREAAA